MKRTALLLCTALTLAAATGCPDASSSRDPQTTSEIAVLRADLDGLRRRVTELENREPKTVINNYIGSAPSGTGVAPVAPTPQASPAPQASPSPQASASETSPTPEATETAGGDAPRSLEQRSGYDAWNMLNPKQDSETPKRGGKVRVCLSAQPKLLDAVLDNSAVTGYITGYINEPLIDQDPITFEYRGALAESWTAEDMLMEIAGSEPITDVTFDASMQKWSREEGGETQTWWPWQIRKAGDGFELLSLKEHRGMATLDGDTWTLKTDAGVETYKASEVARVNKGTVFTFKLRKGVRFHDGEPLTADDVVWTLNMIKCPYVDAPALRSYYEEVRPAEKLDDYTVRIVYEKQYYDALSFAGGYQIFPKHIFDPNNLLQNDPKAFGEAFKKNDYQRKPIGTGPYKFKDWVQNKSVTLVRNEDYWDPKKPCYLDEIVWRFITDSNTALSALRAREIDFLPAMTPEQFFKETDTDQFKKSFVKPVYYYGNYSYVGWNMRRPPFDDVRVRRAMAYGAVDIPAFIKNVLYGAAVQVAGSQYIYGAMYDNSVKPYPFDPAMARKLLREAGWFDRDGDGIIENSDRVPFEFELLMPSGSTTGRQLAAIMVENLKALGIKMNIRELEWAVFIENINSRQFDACRLGWAQGPKESDPFQLWHSSTAENRGSNHCGWLSPQGDQLILKIRETLDDDARRKLHHQFQRLLYGDQPYLFLYCSPNLAAYDPAYHGVRFTAFRPGYDLTEWYDTRVQ